MGRHCIDRQIVRRIPDKLIFDAMKNFYCKQKQNQENSVTLKVGLLLNYTHKRRRPNPSTKKPDS